jgi:hypothetical protein
MLVVRADGFVDPCIPGWRDAAALTRRGYDWTDRYPAIASAAAKLPAEGRPPSSCVGRHPRAGAAVLMVPGSGTDAEDPRAARLAACYEGSGLEPVIQGREADSHAGSTASDLVRANCAPLSGIGNIPDLPDPQSWRVGVRMSSLRT